MPFELIKYSYQEFSLPKSYSYQEVRTKQSLLRVNSRVNWKVKEKNEREKVTARVKVGIVRERERERERALFDSNKLEVEV